MDVHGAEDLGSGGVLWAASALADLGRILLREAYGNDRQSFLDDAGRAARVRGAIRRMGGPGWVPEEESAHAVPFYLGERLPRWLAGDADPIEVIARLAASASDPWDRHLAQALARHAYRLFRPEGWRRGGLAATPVRLSDDALARCLWSTYVERAALPVGRRNRMQQRMRRELHAVVGELRLGFPLAVHLSSDVLQYVALLELDPDELESVQATIQRGLDKGRTISAAWLDRRLHREE
ncbi:MAG: hypothetical protein H6739_16325 [Alphaproteobacteria bacterium]|nr:hypothetical protein [Alphaproteobacteria bacterium]